MLSVNPHHTKPYFISSFIGGLQDEIKSMVKLLKQLNLSKPFEQAKLQEATIKAMMKRHVTFEKCD